MEMAESDAYRPRTKHIDIRFHFIRDVIQAGKVCMDFKKSEENIADGLTKAISIQKLIFCAKTNY